MARSINGNLLGLAARTEIRDILEAEQIRKGRFAREWRESETKLQSLLGDDFNAWWDGYPEDMSRGDFLPIMKEKIIQLERDALYTYVEQLVGGEGRIEQVEAIVDILSNSNLFTEKASHYDR